MIQRIQSLFLLATTLAMFCMVIFPLWDKTKEDGTERIEVNVQHVVHYKINDANESEEILQKKNVIYIAFLAVMAAVLAFYNIFQYKNRLVQTKICAATAFLIMAALAVSAFIIFDAERIFESSIKGNYKAGFFMSALALIFNSLAVRFIRRDEKLVRSVDRIR
jgi:glucan phosphoethanolaminetransferase (alkaline phosphatase superfamily)